MFTQRFSSLQNAMQEEGIQAAVFNAGGVLKYLTGLEFHLSERPVMLLVTQNDKPALFFPEFEREKAESSKIELDLFSYGEDQETWAEGLSAAVKSRELKDMPIAVPQESMRFLELDLLEKATGNHLFNSAGVLLQNLLSRKDPAEIDSIKKAVYIAESAMERLLEVSFSGKTEKEIANLLVIKLLENGSDPELPFTPIVASGPNSANPHAVPGERILSSGDLLVIDWGARCGGYISDITRTFTVENFSEEFQLIEEIVIAANAAGREAASAGAHASEVDKAARSVVNDAGFGQYFSHRTGHGIGMQAHEEPYISADSTAILEKGMTFTVEPGIYLPGRGGIRIEDNMLITETGAETLTGLPRKIRIIK